MDKEIINQRDRFAKELVDSAIWYSEDGDMGCRGCSGELTDVAEKKRDDGEPEDEFKAEDIDHEEDCVIWEAYNLIEEQKSKSAEVKDEEKSEEKKVCTCSSRPGPETLTCQVHGFKRG